MRAIEDETWEETVKKDEIDWGYDWVYAFGIIYGEVVYVMSSLEKCKVFDPNEVLIVY